MPSPAPTNRDSLKISIKRAERALLDRAAELKGQTLSSFILEASRKAAEEALLDRSLSVASPEAYAAFIARLDVPTASNAPLARALRTPPPWEE